MQELTLKFPNQGGFLLLPINKGLRNSVPFATEQSNNVTLCLETFVLLYKLTTVRVFSGSIR